MKLQTKEYFEEGSSNIKIERTILEMSDPSAEVTLNEYMAVSYTHLFHYIIAKMNCKQQKVP